MVAPMQEAENSPSSRCWICQSRPRQKRFRDAMADFETWCGFGPPNPNCHPDMDEELSASSSSTFPNV